MATKRKPKSRLRRSGPKPAFAPAQIRLDARRLQALRLRENGYTYRKIGELLTPPCKTTRAFEIILEALAEVASDTAETAEVVRAIELDRLDEMMIKPFEAAKNGDLRAIDAVLKIMDRRAKILGLDAPTKQEHSGLAGGPITVTGIERTIVDPTVSIDATIFRN